MHSIDLFAVDQFGEVNSQAGSLAMSRGIFPNLLHYNPNQGLLRDFLRFMEGFSGILSFF